MGRALTLAFTTLWSGIAERFDQYFLHERSVKRHFAVGGDFDAFDIGRPFLERGNTCRIRVWRDTYLFVDKLLIEQAQSAKLPLRPVCPYVSGQSSKEPLCNVGFAPGQSVMISFQR